LQKFKLNTWEAKMNYTYTCCSVDGSLAQATLEQAIPEAVVAALTHDQVRSQVITLLEEAQKCGGGVGGGKEEQIKVPRRQKM